MPYKNMKIWTASAPRCVELAIANLKSDFFKVFNQTLENTELNEADIVIASYDKLKDNEPIIQRLSTSELFDANQELRWEAFLIEELDGKLYIIGSDKRGLIFGIYEFCQSIGVSPWHFFADVPVKKKTTFTIETGFKKVEYPSVKYRGIFINDEEELNNWAKAHTGDGTIGPETYIHIFELLLRLKANYIWPAMHVNFFNNDPKNGFLANDMGIIVGTSHCDMLLRSNQNEWEPWLLSKGYKDVKYDYSVEGNNRTLLQEYWSESVQMNKDYDVSFTVGMRGIHDSGFITEVIDNDPTLTAPEKTDKKMNLLETVITDQRNILQNVLKKPAEEILQTFVPYKEVLEYYDKGLKVPEDVTIIWANDNYGYMRRYPSLKEQKRSGGHGLYYHSSYWAPTNMHYVFITSTPLARMKNELQKSWDNGIRKLWVLNVGAIKPIEQDMEFFTRFAWEVGKEKTTVDIEQFLSDWIDLNFSGNIGTATAKILNDFSQTTNVRKIEQMSPGAFSQTAYGDEAARRLNRLKKLYDGVNQIAAKLPADEKEAFFQLAQMKIHAAYYKNGEFYFGDRSVLANQQGKLNAADEYCRLSAKYTDYMRWMIYYYNKIMGNGKWDRILTPELAPPPNMMMYPTTKPSLKIDAPGLGITYRGYDTKLKGLCFSPYDTTARWIEIFNKGAGQITYKITSPEWLLLSETEGCVKTEVRIFITVDNIEQHFGTSASIVITDNFGNSEKVPVTIQDTCISEHPDDNCYMETDGYISIPAADYKYKTDLADNCWRCIPYLGRYEGSALEAYSPKLTALDTDTFAVKPTVSYEVCFTTSGNPLLEIFRLPTLNSVGQIRIGVSIDDFPVQIVESDITDEHRGAWKSAVLNETDKLLVSLPYINKGCHTLRLTMIDSYVVLSKLVLYTTTYKTSNLGPVYSQTYGGYSCCSHPYEALPLPVNMDERCREYYQCNFSVVPLPDIFFAHKDFYHQSFLNEKTIRLPQLTMAAKHEYLRADSTKDIITDSLNGYQISTKDGHIAFEAEAVLIQNETAYSSSALPGALPGEWEYLGTPTNGGTGLGMYINGPDGVCWERADHAPAMHYTLQTDHEADYFVWLFLKYDDKGNDQICIGINGEVQPLDQQYNSTGFFNYLNMQIWHWNLTSKVHLKYGKNTFSIYGRSAQVKIDRIYLTVFDELPPMDCDWKLTYKYL